MDVYSKGSVVRRETNKRLIGLATSPLKELPNTSQQLIKTVDRRMVMRSTTIKVMVSCKKTFNRLYINEFY